MNTSQLNQLQKQGKIQNFTVSKRQQTYKDSSTKPRKDLPVIPTAAKRSEEKGWMHWNLLYWANAHSLQVEEEYIFHSSRKWRFDFAIPSLRIAIEYNGIVSEKSRHTTNIGYSEDMRKLNAAQILGWKVLQYTPFNYKDLLNDLKGIVR